MAAGNHRAQRDGGSWDSESDSWRDDQEEGRDESAAGEGGAQVTCSKSPAEAGFQLGLSAFPSAQGCFWEGLLDLFSELPRDGEGRVIQVCSAV